MADPIPGRRLAELDFLDDAVGAELYGEKGGQAYRLKVGEPNGLQTLDASGKTPIEQIPDEIADLPASLADFSNQEHLWPKKQQWGLAAANHIINYEYNDTTKPFMFIRRDGINPDATMRCLGLYQNCIQDGGVSNGTAWTEYFARNFTLTSGFSIASTDIATARKINGGTLLSQWLVALSPSIADQPNGATFTGKVYCAEFNYGNRWQDFGLSRNINAGSWVGGLLLVPDVVAGPDGFTSADGHFNASFGLIFGPAKSGTAQRRTWTLIHADDNSVPAGGLHMCMRGGSAGANLRPKALLEARDEWADIIDLSPATDITGKAIKLAAAHTIEFGDREVSYGDAIPTSGQWLRGSVRFNNLAMSAQDIAPAWMNVGSGTPGNWAQFGEIIYNGQKAFDPPSIANAGTTTTTVTVTGAALGDFADASFSLSVAGLVVTAYVSAANTVTVVFFNPTGAAVDLGSGTLRARVRKA